LTYPRRNRQYSLSQMILALVYPLVLAWIFAPNNELTFLTSVRLATGY